MLFPRLAISIFSVCVMISGDEAAFAQAYPYKPIRFVTSAVGGGTDFVARIVAQGLSDILGQQVIVENRGNLISIETIAKSAPDGYSLLFNGQGLWIGPMMQARSYDVMRDFLAVSMSDSSPNVLVVNPATPTRSVKELIALAKAKPGEINYATGATGGPPHLSGELLKAMAGINVVRVPFKGGGPAVIGLLGNQVQMMFATSSSVTSHVKAGKLIALAVTSAQPSALFPGLPTVASSVPGYESSAINGLFAPAGTPARIVNVLSQQVARHVNRPDVKEKLFAAGVEAVGSSPQQSAATLKAEIAKWSKVIKDAGIRED